MGLLLRLPLLVILAGFAALAMLVPGLYAHALEQHGIGADFLGCAGLFLILAGIVALGLAWLHARRQSSPVAEVPKNCPA